MDDEVYLSASKIRKSAAFGEIIIMTVYLPLLTLAGIEGKDVPPHGDDHLLRHTRGIHLVAHVCADGKRVCSSARRARTSATYSDRLIEKLRGWYLPVITKSLNWSKALIASMGRAVCGQPTYLQ